MNRRLSSPNHPITMTVTVLPPLAISPTPAQLMQQMLASFLSVPGPAPIEQIKKDFIPNYVSTDYKHRVHNLPPGAGIEGMIFYHESTRGNILIGYALFVPSVLDNKEALH